MSLTSPDAKAVVRAIDALTTQVKRLADIQSTPVVEPEPGTDDDTTTCPTPLTHNWGCGCPTDEARAVDEDAQRTTRRNSAAVLLARAVHGVLTPAEGEELRRHVNAEIREADTARRSAELADAVTAETKRLLERRTTTLRRRAESAETELRTLRTGLRANGADPTQIQNLWAQIRLRNRQWRDAKRERDEAQAAIERVREVPSYVERVLALSGPGVSRSAVQGIADRLRAALDGTEQP